MPTIEVGRVCVKVNGRETGQKCVIVDVIDKNFVLVTGPQKISGVRRRRTNVKHLEPTEDSIDIKKGASDEDASSSEAPFLISMESSVGSRCFTFVLLRRTPEIFCGPVTRTKFLSITSTITHFCPVSRPLTFTQTRPTSMVGIGTIFLGSRGRNPHLRFRRFSLGFLCSSYHYGR